MVAVSSLTYDNCYGIEMDNLQGTLVQSKMVVRSTRTNGLCKIKDEDMQKPVLQAGLYTEISRESVRPGCWVAERTPGEAVWTVGKVHNVVSSDGGKAVQLGVYYPGDTNGDAVATVALRSTAGSTSAEPSGCFGVRSTRRPVKQQTTAASPRKSRRAGCSGPATAGAAGAAGAAAASMVFFKPNSLRYLDTEGAECLMSSVRVQGRALLDRREQLDTRERLLAEHECQVQQALDDVSSERVAHATHLDTRERLLSENESKVQRALDHASTERITTAAHWHGVKHAFHEHRELVLARDVDSRLKHCAGREGATQAACEQHAVELQRATDSLLKANATIESHVSAAANGKALLAAEKANAVQANQRLANANASLQAYAAKTGGSATREQHVSEQRAAKLNSAIEELTSHNAALTSSNAELTSENAELATNNEQQVRRVTLLQMTAKDSERLHNEERSRTKMHNEERSRTSERLRRSSPPPTGAPVPSANHTHVAYKPKDAAAYNMHTTASASTQDWNRSRDENLKPLARGTRSSRELYQPQQEKQPTASSHNLTHDQFVESVINHMQFDGV